VHVDWIYFEIIAVIIVGTATVLAQRRAKNTVKI
jgi:hypothetical protein